MRTLGLLLLALLLAGCNQQDRDALSRVGRKLIANLEDAAATSPGPLGSGIQAVRGSVGGNLDGRVVLRLRWERDLDGCTIRVRTLDPKTIQLEGVLKDETQRARALEIARATTGVEVVEDRLRVKEAVEPVVGPGEPGGAQAPRSPGRSGGTVSIFLRAASTAS